MPKTGIEPGPPTQQVSAPESHYTIASRAWKYNIKFLNMTLNQNRKNLIWFIWLQATILKETSFFRPYLSHSRYIEGFLFIEDFDYLYRSFPYHKPWDPVEGPRLFTMSLHLCKLRCTIEVLLNTWVQMKECE